MRARVAALLVGVVFGVTLCWSGMSDPDVIRGALLFEAAYLFLFFGSAVAVATIGTEVLRRVRRRAVLADVSLSFSRQRPTRAHVAGSLLFGIGWGVADACPGPIATQIGQAIPWAACTLAGLVLGIALFMRVSTETEPAEEEAPARPRVVASGAKAPAHAGAR